MLENQLREKKDEEPLVVGICGPPGSGKDEAADYLCRHFGFEKTPFAEGVYSVAAAALGRTERGIDRMKRNDEKVPHLDMTMRRFLQLIGTECFRNQIHRDFWIHRTQEMIESHSEKGSFSKTRFVIPGVRFSNEVQFVLSYKNGYMLRVSGPDHREGAKTEDHSSEPDYIELIARNVSEDLADSKSFVVQNQDSLATYRGRIALFAHSTLDLEE